MAADYFLKLDPKIEGEATDGKHKGEIELESWSFASERLLGTLSGGSGSGKSVPGDFLCTKRQDKSSPRLAQAVAMGDHFKPSSLCASRGGAQQEHHDYQRRLHRPISELGTGNGVLPMESLSLNYAQMVQEQEQKADGSLGGSVKLGYDWAKQEKK